MRHPHAEQEGDVGMPWQERSIMSERLEFVTLAGQEGANLSELARRYGISRKTAYKWRERFAVDGAAGLVDQSRRPAHAPNQTDSALEARILATRDAHPSWGGRNLHHHLGGTDAGMPAPSTITAILRRHGRLDPV